MDKEIKPGMLVRYFTGQPSSDVGLLVKIHLGEGMGFGADQLDYLCEILPRNQHSTIVRLLSGLTEVKG